MSKLYFIVQEQGREKHDGDFNTIFHICEDMEEALRLYEKEKLKLFDDKDFYLRDKLLDCDYFENFNTSSNDNELPCLSIENDWEFYELYVSEFERND